MYDALILAGGQNNKQLSRFSSQSYEALIDIDGKPMVTFVVNALLQSRQVGRILVIGPARELGQCGFPSSVIIVEGGATIMDTIALGMEALGHSDKVLVATADIPLLTADAVDDFIGQCSGGTADLYYPVVPKEVNERHYPGNQRTYVRLKEGVYTGGNLFLVDPRIVPHCMDLARKIIDNRKRPFKLCQMLGWTFVFRFLAGTLRLREVERRVSELLHIRGAVIQSHYPELGIDVDKPSDLEMVRTAVKAPV
ncbi:nucleotide-diphospho-sugar transferases [Lucifera butyrica]|uniref:Nucleotide-diphospho-sugar transferases n=1 Tax=Lucifera butyrica TaxID=1351585 RepID=A0A498R5X4_9FIRM|nr:nucleotidyltransferase family protein [Lucifera butyrica]VBB06559.1 nucleotide-diphospho-sugar transferases [Lucifera butyrica]